MNEPTWKPEYERWRHGGWYTNVRYPSGACGCVSNNYPDKKWRIVCREEAGTFASRTEAAHAERAIVLAEYLNIIARRCDEYAVAIPDASAQFNALRDFALFQVDKSALDPDARRRKPVAIGKTGAAKGYEGGVEVKCPLPKTHKQDDDDNDGFPVDVDDNTRSYGPNHRR